MVEELSGVCVDVICSATFKPVYSLQVLLISAAVGSGQKQKGVFAIV